MSNEPTARRREISANRVSTWAITAEEKRAFVKLAGDKGVSATLADLIRKAIARAK